MSEISNISKLISDNESEIERLQDPANKLSSGARQDMIEHLERNNDKLKELNTKLTKMSNELKGLEDDLKAARDSHDRKKVREINKKISDKSSELKQMKKDARLDFKGYDSEGYNQGTRRDIVSCAFGQIGRRIHNFVYKEDTRHGDFAWKINKAIARFNLKHPLLGILASGVTFIGLNTMSAIVFGTPLLGMIASAAAIGRRIPQFVNGDSKLVRNYHIKKGGYIENIKNSSAEYSNCLDIRKSISSIDADNIHKKVSTDGHSHDDTLESDENAKKHKKIKEKLNSVNLGDRSDDNILNLNALLSECQTCAALLDDEDKAKLREIENFILGNYGDLVKKDIKTLNLMDIENELEQLKHRKERIEAGSVRIMSEEARNAISAKLREIEEYQKELEKRKDLFDKMSPEIRQNLNYLASMSISDINEMITKASFVATDNEPELDKLRKLSAELEKRLLALFPYRPNLLPEENEKIEKLRELRRVIEAKLSVSDDYKKGKDEEAAKKLLEKVEQMFINSRGLSLDVAIKNNDVATVAAVDNGIGLIMQEVNKNPLVYNHRETFKDFAEKISEASEKIIAFNKEMAKATPLGRLSELVDKFDASALSVAMKNGDLSTVRKIQDKILDIKTLYDGLKGSVTDSILLNKIISIVGLMPEISDFIGRSTKGPAPMPAAVPVPGSPIDFPSHKVTVSNVESVDVKLISGEAMGIDGYIATSVQFRGKDGRFIGKQYNDVGGKPIVFTSNDADDIVRELNNYFDGFTGTVNVRYSSKTSKR